MAGTNKLDSSQLIGITEGSEVAFNLQVFDNLYDGNIIITKRLTGKLVEKLLENKEKVILHCCCTGFGQTKVEPLVPSVEQTYRMFCKLVDGGFPISHVVLRIDPVIPTKKGIETARKVVETFKGSGIRRVRFSVLDMYKHAKERFTEAGFPIPYKTFHAPYELRKAVLRMFEEYGEKYGFDVEACAEPGIESVSCLSQKDIEILGLAGKVELVGNKGQRGNCGCPANKKELIKGKPHRCEHSCIYCFWKD